jgi:hypothetical protein
LQELLDSGYRVLIYNGQLDIIIANSLTQALVDSLQWKGKDDFVKVGTGGGGVKSTDWL